MLQYLCSRQFTPLTESITESSCFQSWPQGRLNREQRDFKFKRFGLQVSNSLMDSLDTWALENCSNLYLCNIDIGYARRCRPGGYLMPRGSRKRGSKRKTSTCHSIPLIHTSHIWNTRCSNTLFVTHQGRIWPPDGATCFSCIFGHQVQNLVIRWRHLTFFLKK